MRNNKDSIKIFNPPHHSVVPPAPGGEFSLWNPFHKIVTIDPQTPKVSREFESGIWWIKTKFLEYANPPHHSVVPPAQGGELYSGKRIKKCGGTAIFLNLL